MSLMGARMGDHAWCVCSRLTISPPILSPLRPSPPVPRSGIANGGDLPPEFLGAIYDAIVATPISLREDDEKRKVVEAKGGPADERQRRALQAAERAEMVIAGQAAMTQARRTALAQQQASSAASAVRLSAGGEAPAAGDDGSGYYTIHDVSNLGDHVRHMLDISWAAFLAVFSVILETAGDDDARAINTCLVGFAQAIHVAGSLGCATERDAFVVSLCKFTCLDASATSGVGGLREMRPKNVACTRALLNIALNEGDRLGRAWGPVLVCMSQLARLLVLAAGGKEDSEYFSDAGRPLAGTGPAAPPPVRHGAATTAAAAAAARASGLERDAAVERHNASILRGAVDEADITRIYTRSTALSSTGVVDFVTQLAAVSLQELAAVVRAPHDFPTVGADAPAPSAGGAAPTPGGGGGSGAVVSHARPRIFSLQKVVEVADYNMNTRSRMVWARLWDNLTAYFTSVCCSPNTSIALYAIDSLKQLSAKFLEKPELRSFHFQTKFLQPFVTLMEAAAADSRATAAAGGPRAKGAAPATPVKGRPLASVAIDPSAPLAPSPEIRELILHVCGNLIRARVGNIRSGWRSFMGVYAAAAANSDQLLVSLAFSTVHDVLSNHLPELATNGAFVDGVKVMVAFGGNRHEIFALRAVDHCATLGAHLARGRVVPLSDEAVDDFDVQPPAAGTAAGASSGGAAPRSRASSSSLAALPAPSASSPDEPSSSSSSSEWYDLGGPENGDVHDDRRERSLRARMGGSRGGAGEDDSESQQLGGGGGGDDEADEALMHENATDAAMLAADPEVGGRIKRFSDSRLHLRLWWPLLTGLAGLVSGDARAAVRLRALNALFALLRRYGPGFSPALWRLVYGGVLLPIFDDVRHEAEAQADRNAYLAAQPAAGGSRGAAGAAAASSPVAGGAPNGAPSSGGSGGDLEGPDRPAHFSLTDFATRSVPAPRLEGGAGGAGGVRGLWPAARGKTGGEGAGAAVGVAESAQQHEWLRTTCLPALAALVRLQCRFFTRLGPLLPSLLGLIESCVDQEIEGLARIGVTCLRLLLAEAGPRFGTPTWDAVVGCMGRLFDACSPVPLLEARGYLLEGRARPAASPSSGSRQSSDAFSDHDDDEEEPEAEAPLAAAPVGGFAAGLAVLTPYGPGTVTGAPAPALPGAPAGTLIVPVRLAYGTAFMPAAGLTAAKPTVGVPPASPAKAAAARPASVRSPAPAAAAPSAPAAAPASTPGGLRFSSVRVVTQCVVQLELISAVGVLADAHLPSLTYGHVEALLGLLQRSADFARRFNGDRPLRRALWEAGFMRVAKQANKLPSLLRQEAAATQQLLILLMRLYTVEAQQGGLTGPQSPAAIAAALAGAEGSAAPLPASGTFRDMAVAHLASLARGMVARYTRLAVEVERARMLVTPPYMHGALAHAGGGDAARARAGSLGGAGGSHPTSALLDGSGAVDRDLFREAAAYGPLVLTLLRELLAFDDAQFLENLPWLWPILTGLVVAGNIEIRDLLASVFETRIASLIGIAPGAHPAAAVGGSGSLVGGGAPRGLTEAASALGQLQE